MFEFLNPKELNGGPKPCPRGYCNNYKVRQVRDRDYRVTVLASSVMWVRVTWKPWGGSFGQVNPLIRIDDAEPYEEHEEERESECTKTYAER